MCIGNAVLEMEPRASDMLGRHSNPGLYIERPNILVKMNFTKSGPQNEPE